MSTNSAGTIIFFVSYLITGITHYGVGFASSPCRTEHVSISRSLFWPSSLNYEVIGGTSSLKDFLLSSDCRDFGLINPKRTQELLDQARGSR